MHRGVVLRTQLLVMQSMTLAGWIWQFYKLGSIIIGNNDLDCESSTARRYSSKITLINSVNKIFGASIFALVIQWVERMVKHLCSRNKNDTTWISTENYGFTVLSSLIYIYDDKFRKHTTIPEIWNRKCLRNWLTMSLWQ